MMPVRYVEHQPPLLRLQRIRTYYPIKKGIFSRTVGEIKAVDGIDLDIYEGETVGLVGESGCGKSSLGRSIIKLERMTGGKVLYQGQDLASLSMAQMRKLRTDIQMIFQDPYSSLNPRKRIVDILTEPMKVLLGLSEAEALKIAYDLMETVGLSPKNLGKYPHEFSGGQRQRIGIARALGLKPKLIICDEPVSALDVSIQAQVLNLLKSLQKQYNLTYLFIGHGLGAVKYMSDRIAVMYLGRIVEIASAKQLFASPQHPYTKALLEAYPIPDPLLREAERIVLKGDVPNPASVPQGCSFHTRCPLAQPRCFTTSPLLEQHEGRLVACHLPLTGRDKSGGGENRV